MGTKRTRTVGRTGSEKPVREKVTGTKNVTTVHRTKERKDPTGLVLNEGKSFVWTRRLCLKKSKKKRRN